MRHCHSSIFSSYFYQNPRVPTPLHQTFHLRYVPYQNVHANPYDGDGDQDGISDDDVDLKGLCIVTYPHHNRSRAAD